MNKLIGGRFYRIYENPFKTREIYIVVEQAQNYQGVWWVKALGVNLPEVVLPLDDFLTYFKELKGV